MHVAMVAPLWESVPPRGYGAIESLVADLVDGLAGSLDITLSAAGDSRTDATLLAGSPAALNALRCAQPEIYRMRQLVQLRARASSFDVVHVHLHNHTGLAALAALVDLPVPVIYTMHGALSANVVALMREARPRLMVGVSRFQIAPLAGSGIPTAVVPLGIRVGRFPMRTTPDDPPYLLFLGRIRDLKGVHLAIDIAELAGLPLTIAGPIRPEDYQYFEAAVRPRLSERIVFVGAVDRARRDRLLSGATALLFTSTHDDPFGLVMLEAMACGTPVLALDQCAVSEILTHGRTGYRARGVDDAAAAVAAVRDLDRCQVRREVAAHFDAMAMARRYLALYSSALTVA